MLNEKKMEIIATLLAQNRTIRPGMQLAKTLAQEAGMTPGQFVLAVIGEAAVVALDNKVPAETFLLIAKTLGETLKEAE